LSRRRLEALCGSVAHKRDFTYDIPMRFTWGAEEIIPLDNAAIIYPPTLARYNSHMFRLSMDLTIPVEGSRLLVALERVMTRFPYFSVSLHQGFFWYYLTNHHKKLSVYPEHAYPCAFLDRHHGANGYLFKVFWREDRIAVEIFHALCDGTGGLVFLKSLVAEYLRLSGIEIGEDPQIFRPGTPVGRGESDDSFQHFYKPLGSVMNREPAAFHYARFEEISDRVQVISAQVGIADVKRLGTQYDCTITEYLVAELIDAFQRVQEQTVGSRKHYKPISISVPVNIRRVFDSDSMRNFTLFVTPRINPRLGYYEFEEIVQQVKFQIRGSVNIKSLSQQISRNVAGERNPLLRFAPNILKGPVMKILSDSYGDKTYSTTISNIGEVKLPSGMREVVKRADFYLSPSKSNKVSCSVVGVNGMMSINFTNFLVKQTVIEREFLTALVAKGIPVRIADNRNPHVSGR